MHQLGMINRHGPVAVHLQKNELLLKNVIH